MRSCHSDAGAARAESINMKDSALLSRPDETNGVHIAIRRGRINNGVNDQLEWLLT